MPDQAPPTVPTLAAHGAAQLTAVSIDAYNAELRSAEGFVGDRASNRAFRAIIEDWRERLRQVGADPFGDTPSENLSKKKLDKLLTDGDPEAAGLVQAAIEEFAQELATVIRRFLRLKAWHKTQRIVIGGGLRASRIGEVAIGRAGIILKAEGNDLELKPIRHHPDEAGLIGCIHLAPSWIFAGHDSILGIDIGGSNIRTGVVELNAKKSPDLSDAKVREFELWRHCDDKPKRDEAIERLGTMLEHLIQRAIKDGLKLAPVIGIGCPGLIREDGSIKRGGQNLPGNWESKKFNLAQRLVQMIPTIDRHETTVLVHNDAVVQGLSEVPFTRDVERWGVLTIGTGLGNARFTNRAVAKEKGSDKG
jgi:predicted NBD/HSP70 family sugar kinase